MKEKADEEFKNEKKRRKESEVSGLWRRYGSHSRMQLKREIR